MTGGMDWCTVGTSSDRGTHTSVTATRKGMCVSRCPHTFAGYSRLQGTGSGMGFGSGPSRTLNTPVLPSFTWRSPECSGNNTSPWRDATSGPPIGPLQLGAKMRHRPTPIALVKPLTCRQSLGSVPHCRKAVPLPHPWLPRPPTVGRRRQPLDLVGPRLHRGIPHRTFSVWSCCTLLWTAYLNFQLEDSLPMIYLFLS